jgi:hypothetical protein
MLETARLKADRQSLSRGDPPEPASLVRILYRERFIRADIPSIKLD